MKKRKVILDCDPGHDDAFALYMLLAAENVDLLAVVAAAGNQTRQKTYSNTCRLLSLAGREDIPVAQGFERPIRHELTVAANIHGDTGIDGAILPDIEIPEPTEKCIDLMARVIRELDEKVTIVATGPLTDVAILLLAHPELKERIELISFMGGACFGGNWSANAEFNIYVDPDAADIVCRSGVPLAMFGLDVTLKAQFMNEDIDRIRAIDTPVSRCFVGILEFFGTKVAQPFLAEPGHVEGQHLHDACAAAYVIDPSLFRMVDLNVAVDTREGLGYASTVVDWNKKSGRPANASVGFDLDRAKFVDLIVDSLSSFK